MAISIAQQPKAICDYVFIIDLYHHHNFKGLHKKILNHFLCIGGERKKYSRWKIVNCRVDEMAERKYLNKFYLNFFFGMRKYFHKNIEGKLWNQNKKSTNPFYICIHDENPEVCFSSLIVYEWKYRWVPRNSRKNLWKTC